MENKEKKLPRLTRKQKLFVDEYINNGGNGAQAAKVAYNIWGKKWSNTEAKATTTSSVIANENLKKPSIQHYLQEYWDQAGCVIKDIMLNGDKDTTRLDAAKYVYDQVHGKATQKIESKGIDINIDINNASVDDLLQLIKSK